MIVGLRRKCLTFYPAETSTKAPTVAYLISRNTLQLLPSFTHHYSSRVYADEYTWHRERIERAELE